MFIGIDDHRPFDTAKFRADPPRKRSAVIEDDWVVDCYLIGTKYFAFGYDSVGRSTALKWLNENISEYQLYQSGVVFKNEEDAILFYLAFA